MHYFCNAGICRKFVVNNCLLRFVFRIAIILRNIYYNDTVAVKYFRM